MKSTLDAKNRILQLGKDLSGSKSLFSFHCGYTFGRSPKYINFCHLGEHLHWRGWLGLITVQIQVLEILLDAEYPQGVMHPLRLFDRESPILST